MRTQVGIVGAGPAGLMLAHLLHLEGIESVILENRSRDYIESRIRAGLLEQWASDLLVDTGVGERMQREGMFHDGVYFAFDGALHHIDFRDAGRQGRDHLRPAGGGEGPDRAAARRRRADPVRGRPTSACTTSPATARRKSASGTTARSRSSTAISSAAATAFTASAGRAFRPALLTAYDREYPFAWVGILSESPPPENELIYTYHERGFALYTMRSPTLARLYLQCPPDEEIENWPDVRIWQELHTRIGGTRALAGRRHAAEGHHRRCAASWSSRCSMAGCFSPAIPPTSSRRPAPRA